MVFLTLNSIMQHPDNLSGFIKYINGCVDRFISESSLDSTTEDNIRNSVNYELGKYYCVVDEINNTDISESCKDDLQHKIDSINISLNHTLENFHINV